MSPAQTDNHERRLAKLERAVGAVLVYAERQNRRSNPRNLLALQSTLAAIDATSGADLEEIRQFFTNCVPGR